MFSSCATKAGNNLRVRPTNNKVYIDMMRMKTMNRFLSPFFSSSCSWLIISYPSIHSFIVYEIIRRHLSTHLYNTVVVRMWVCARNASSCSCNDDLHAVNLLSRHLLLFVAPLLCHYWSRLAKFGNRQVQRVWSQGTHCGCWRLWGWGRGHHWRDHFRPRVNTGNSKRHLHCDHR